MIAADIDKTILGQDADERHQFVRTVAPQLLRAASLGTNLAFLTGNSMNELSTRFVRWLVAQLCHNDQLDLLDQFHLFCNSGGVYARFSTEEGSIADLIQHNPTKDEVMDALTLKESSDKLQIRPEFIDSSYIRRSRIPAVERDAIAAAIQQPIADYMKRVQDTRTSHLKKYDIRHLSADGVVPMPQLDDRVIRHGAPGREQADTVQITVKPVLSFRHGVNTKQVTSLIGRDLRKSLTNEIQLALDRAGLMHYIARPGGRSSIDITLHKLDKAYGLEFLIDRLNLQGHAREGKKFGSNVIYFGDEVIAGSGNDYAVTRIPGLLVFAVNSDKHLIPFLSHVYVPSSILEGPDATTDVLTEFNRIARRLTVAPQPSTRRGRSLPQDTALDLLKKELFSRRITDKIGRLRSEVSVSADDWQTLHAFVTLLSREDEAGKQWLSVLRHELDEIMTQMSRQPGAQPALGTGSMSHPDA